MKTKIFIKIYTEEHAKAYIKALYDNSELYHFDDNAEDINWNNIISPTKQELKQLDINRDKLFEILGDPFDYCSELIFGKNTEKKI